MKKSLIVVAFSVIFAGNAFAACNNTPYMSPDELQSECTQDISADSSEVASSVENGMVSNESDLVIEPNAAPAKKLMAEKADRQQ